MHGDLIGSRIMKLDISVEYMVRDRGAEIVEWLLAYLKRNKIHHEYVFKMVDDKGTEERYMRIHFRSEWQRGIFVYKGNQNFPYFEFV